MYLHLRISRSRLEIPYREVTMHRWAQVLVVLGVSVWPGPRDLAAQDPVEKQFTVLLELLPADVRDEVTLLVPGDDGLRTYRKGTGHFVCIGDPPGDGRLNVVCHHESLGPVLSHQRSLSEGGLRGKAFQERLCRDVRSGIVEMPDRAYMLDASAALKPDGSLPDSVTVYHMLQLPYATEGSAGISDEELVPGKPWLHHAGTCDAHLMWSEKRAVPSAPMESLDGG